MLSLWEICLHLQVNDVHKSEINFLKFQFDIVYFENLSSTEKCTRRK